jgi:hypothetical protein
MNDEQFLTLRRLLRQLHDRGVENRSPDEQALYDEVVEALAVCLLYPAPRAFATMAQGASEKSKVKEISKLFRSELAKVLMVDSDDGRKPVGVFPGTSCSRDGCPLKE